MTPSVLSGHTVRATAVYQYFTLVTSRPFPSWAAVTGAGDMVTGGVIQTVTNLATAIAVGS